MESSNSQNKAIIGIIVVVLLVAAATAVIVMSANNDQPESSTVSDTSTSPSVSASPEAEASSDAASSLFKNGTYMATGNYQTPGGRESIGVTVTLSDGVVSDASVEQNATGGEAAEYQEKFVAAFKSQVVGKKIDEVSLSRVAGSSLTPNGFNNAIQDIENQAKA
jgi:hypothetical protein